MTNRSTMRSNRKRGNRLGIDLLDYCVCDDPFANNKNHALGNVFMAECTWSFRANFGDEENPDIRARGDYREMLSAVADKIGWHRVAKDINAKRIAAAAKR
jgi:hypothetical protein